MLILLFKRVCTCDINVIKISDILNNILYVVLEHLVEVENQPIKKCQNCGKRFIPTTRLDEVYYDFLNGEGKTCRESGTSQKHKKKLADIPVLLEYRKSYQKKIMVVSKNKENKKDFDKWKKEAQDRIRKFKKGELSMEKLYKCMMEKSE